MALAMKHDFGKNVTILESPAIRLLFSKIRCKDCNAADFARYGDRLLTILAEEGLARVEGVKPTVVETPCGPYQGLETPPYTSMCCVSIVRSGDILLECTRKLAPGIPVGKILVQRDESDPEKKPKLYYSKLPPHITKLSVLLVDPMLATGGSAIMCTNVLLEAGVPEENILFLNVVSCPEGMRALTAAFPKMKIVTAAMDEGLNEEKYICPGLGDFGDRYYSTGNFMCQT